MSDPIEEFRVNVRKLEPDGSNGFEGLIAAVLGDLTKRSFAVASAGSQRGKDGQSALDGGTIAFEAKRYDDSVPKDTIYTKILEIAATKSSIIELYVLAATTRISTQQIDTLKEAGRRLAMAIVILAWPETGLPELAALLAMTPGVSAKFIAKHASLDEAELWNQLAAIRAHPQFEARSEELWTILHQPSIAPAFALQDNGAWLSAAFSDKNRARIVFGQVLSPSDTSIPCTIDRPALRAKVAESVFAKPDGAVVAILGADGNGKSWIFAQAWVHQVRRPLTVVVVPEEIVGPASLEYCQDLLISKLLTQTGETPKVEARERWLRHFERWQNDPDAAAPCIVVFLDGVNQRVSVNWLRFIDVMSDLTAHLGGRLVFSCRRLFYKDNLDGKLVSRVVPIEVPEWTDPELDALLKERGTSIAALDPGIVRSLRNPRIFGVAANLFQAAQITEFGELSVSRLLFEHIHSGSAVEGHAISPKQFAAGICTHAESIVQRLLQSEEDGISEFDLPGLVTAGQPRQAISEQFVITSAGRFFEVLDESPDKYVLKEEGLPLALGLALVRTAQAAIRNRKSVDEALSKILDPIAALDKTSDIMLGAILAAVLDEAPGEVVTPLVRSFVSLQNIDASRYPEFRNLFGRKPVPFIAALEEAALSRDIVSNFSWLSDAVNELRDRDPFESALSSAIHRWLNMYSLAPERIGLGSDKAEHAAEREQRRVKRERALAEAVAAFCPAEKELLAGMIPEGRGDYCQLCFLAFQALAGRPLAPFAKSLRNWCFATALNGGYQDHHEDFDALLLFNLADWSATRDALRRAATLLRQEGMSRNGQWALVYLLRTTGDSTDAEEAERLADDLTKDRERFGGWRRIDDFCATDPCDPSSEKPDNIDKTAIQYSTIKHSELRRVRNETQDTYVFLKAQPGLARFRPDAAIAGMRAFADQAVTRQLPEFRQAVFLIEDHTAALESRVATSYVEKAREIAQAVLDSGEDKHNEGWVAAQYALGVAFPHMTGDEQFDALLKHPKDKTIFLELAYGFQPINELRVESEFAKAVSEGNTVAQFRILCFAEYSRSGLTERMKELVLGLLKSADDHVRLSSLSLIQATADPVLLGGLVNSRWSAAQLDPASQKIEIFHGSHALVLAAAQGAISLEACLDRISLSAYAALANQLGQEAAIEIAGRLDTAIARAAEFQVSGNLPDIEQSLERRLWPVYLEVSAELPKDATPQEISREHGDNGDAWHARHKRNLEATERFEGDLTKAGAQLIVQSVTVDLIEAIDKVDRPLVDSWHALFLRLDPKALDNVHNIASVVAEAISKRDVTSGLALFEKLKGSSPHVRVTFGRDRIALDAATAWGAALAERMRELCFARLDSIRNDHDIAMEILAAVRADRIDILRDYVVDRRQRAEPAYRARAAMVAGLSPGETWAVETVDLLQGEHGFLNFAYEAAKYALERHQWSRYWASQMRQATDSVDLWRYGVLLARIVDGRFNGAEVMGDRPSALVARFVSTFNGPIQERIRAWKGKRESKLFGMNVPNNAFLPATFVPKPIRNSSIANTIEAPAESNSVPMP